MNIIKKEIKHIFKGEKEAEQVIINLSKENEKVHIKFLDAEEVEEIAFDFDFFTNYLSSIIRDINTRNFNKIRCLKNENGNKKIKVSYGDNRENVKLIFIFKKKLGNTKVFVKRKIISIEAVNNGFDKLKKLKSDLHKIKHGADKMYISSIKIKNFRNFNDIEVSFNEGYQTIIGENNIGKSNLLFAIRLVLDKNLSYSARYLKEKDFHGFRKPDIEDYVLISIEFEGDNLAENPHFHCFKTSENKMRITYIYAHENIINKESITEIEEYSIEDFKWKIVSGGKSNKFEDLINLNKVHLSDLDGINIFYLNDFRNIYSDLRGKNQSLLSDYCISREDSDNELSEVNNILEESTDELNDLDFIPAMNNDINDRNKEIAGNYFSPDVSMGFASDFDDDIWNELELFFKPEKDKTVPIKVLGLGQKNLLYLTLFIATLENKKEKGDINIVLVEEPEAHLHPQLQKVLFANLSNLTSTQVLMTSHSTHIASDCKFKNISLLYKNMKDNVKAYSPFLETDFETNEKKLLKRYLDATRSELFFSSGVIFVEGVSEQFIIPSLCEEVYDLNLEEYNISVIPIYGRHFYTFLKIFNDNHLEIPAVVIIDGDKKEVEDEDEKTTFVKKAKSLEVRNRVRVFSGEETLEKDLFPYDENSDYLEKCFKNLCHSRSYKNLIRDSNEDNWEEEVIKRVDGTIKKGRFAQQLAIEIDEDFNIPDYIDDAIRFIMKAKGIDIDEASE
ncbi:MAG: ATP-dependent nuclease [Bacillota bacterium]